MCDTVPDPIAVHCPQCGAEPGQRCKSPNGHLQQLEHGRRVHLVYALAHPEADFHRAEAEKYRQQYPDVEVGVIRCEASAAQVRWWSRWGRRLRYNREAYEREHGPDTSIPALPSGEPEGMPVSELLERMKEAVRRKPR